MRGVDRARGLGVAALAAVGFWALVLLQLPLFFGRFPRRPAVVDMANYVAAANVGLSHGWSRIYEPALQAPVFLRLTGFSRFEWLDTFVSPPPVAWLAVPLTALPLDAAYWTWTAVSVLAFGTACWLVCPWRGLRRVAALVVGAGLYPVLIAFQFGQVTPLIAAATALAWWQLRRGRDQAAGMLLLPLILKPQVGVVVPVALALAGYRRCFVTWLAGAIAIATLSLLSLGPAGVGQYLSDLQMQQGHLDNQVWTLAWFVGPGPIATGAQALCIVAGLVVGWKARGQGPTLPFVAGSLASLLGAGYHHSIDFPVLLPLALIHFHELPRRAAAALGVVGLVACYATPRLGPGPLLAVAVAWLALTVYLAFATVPAGRPQASRRPDPVGITAAP